jgi:hypothetical protein
MSRKKESNGEAVAQTAEYMAWTRMKYRCSPGHPGARRYAERGLTVHDRWLGERGFLNFLEDVGRRPGNGFTLDRIDNSLGYVPGNVRWATRRQQQRNRDVNVTLTIDGVTKCIAEWAEESPVSDPTIRDRVRKGWSPREAVFAPQSRAGGPKPSPRRAANGAQIE